MPVTLVRRHVHDEHSIAHRIDDGSFDSFILVVPTKRRIRHLTRELISAKQVAVSELPIFTLESLASELLQSAFDHLRIVDEPIQTLLFNQVIISSRNTLKYFNVRGSNAQLPRGTFDKIVEVIKNLKEVGVYPNALTEEIALEAADEQPKLTDIATIYSAYEQELNKLDAVDAEGIFKLLHLHCSQPKFAQTFRLVFPAVEEISIVGFDEFTEPELGFIQKLCAMNVGISVVFDFQLGNPALFGHLEENYERFLEMGFLSRNDDDAGNTDLLVQGEQPADVCASIQHIAQNLFKRDGKLIRKNCSDRITIAKTKDRTREVERICKLIKQLVAENPTRDLSRICVAMYKPQVYTHIMREQFKKYGIPANITDRFELAQSPVVVSIIGLLEVALRSFRREDVLRTVISAYFDFENAGEALDRANLMNVSQELRITAGVRTWLNKIERQVQKAQHDVLMSNDELENSHRINDVASLTKAQSDIKWLESLLRDVSLDQTPTQFQHRLQQLLERLELPQRIVSVGVSNHPELVEKDARAYSKFLEVVEQTVNLLEYQEGKQKRHSLKFYVEQLKVAISQERYNVREQFGQGVLVTSIDETRGLPLDVMIVAGLVDGEFPSVYQSEIFFSNKRMKEREYRYSWENRYLFYQAITNWSEHLYLTYPEQEAELDLVRSSFVDALLDITEVEQWEYPGNSPFEETIYSEDDYMRHHGSQLAHSSVKPDEIPPALHERLHHVEQALKVERSRVDVHNLPEYEGFILSKISDEANEKLRQLKHRVYSVSQLETYGKCPYQFFAQRLLRLNVVEELEEEFSTIEKGSVLHETLFEFYTERRENKLPSLIGCSEKEFEHAVQQLLGIAERKLAEIDIPDAFWDLEKELLLGNRESGKGMLREFLEFERNRLTNLQPKYFEVGFGSDLGSQTRTDTLLSSLEPILAGKVQLRGKVDRVEIGEEAFAIIDYKTGSSVARIDDIHSGISLQLPIYLYTIEKLLAEKHGDELQPAGGLYYQLRNPIALKVGAGSATYKDELGASRSRTNLLPSNDELQKLIDESIQRVNSYVDDIAQGKFPLTTHDKIDKVCTYCDYKTICRIQTVRRVVEAKPEAQ